MPFVNADFLRFSEKVVQTYLQDPQFAGKYPHLNSIIMGSAHTREELGRFILGTHHADSRLNLLDALCFFAIQRPYLAVDNLTDSIRKDMHRSLSNKPINERLIELEKIAMDMENCTQLNRTGTLTDNEVPLIATEEYISSAFLEDCQKYIVAREYFKNHGNDMTSDSDINFLHRDASKACDDFFEIFPLSTTQINTILSHRSKYIEELFGDIKRDEPSSSSSSTEPEDDNKLEPKDDNTSNRKKFR